jgi:hypothetical protein
MKKLGIFRLFLLFVGAVLPSFSAPIPAVFSQVDEGLLWVEKCIEQHPEILWLADADVRKTEENQASLGGSYSEQLFGQKYIEFDRTMMTIRCLKLVLDGSEKSYLEFTAGQSKEDKLSREGFQTFHLEGQRVLKSQWEGISEMEMAQAMETALVLGDIGKSEKARALFRPYGIESPDHDDFHGEVMQMIEKHPELCPSFAQLSCSARKLLVKVANLAHYGHVTHLEGGVAMFRKLRESGIPSEDPMALSFDLFVHTCDVAGAFGHVNHHSSLAYTELTHRALQATGEAMRVLSNPIKTEWDAYNTYLGIRASWLGLNAEDNTDRVLARLGAMLRLFTLEEGVVLKEAMGRFDDAMRSKIIAKFDVQQIDQFSRTPTYVPATLVNLSNQRQLGDSKEERLFQAIIIGLPFITRVLERYKELMDNGEIDPNIPLNFNAVAGIAKSSPSSLNNDFSIDEEGNVRCETR